MKHVPHLKSNLSLRPKSLSAVAIAVIASFSAPVFADDSNVTASNLKASNVELINVFGDYSQLSLDQIAQSATIITSKQLNQRGASHLDGVVSLAPNVNFTSGASRGKYIQIRGIGERSQFSEPLNSSVGLVIDGMDVSGLGGMATLLDTQQVEVLRGPQATVFGTSGLAGVVNIVSNGPTDEPSGSFSISSATQDTLDVQAAYGFTMDNGLGLRGAIKQTTSDGFVKNTYLERDDTNNIDELSARLAASYNITESMSVNAQIFHVDTDNGYDAFSLDNDNVARSDEPGKDTLDATAMSLNLISQTQWGQWRLQSSHTQSDTVYGYDEDWTYVGFHPWEYSSTDYYFRNRDSQTVELQASSNSSSSAQQSMQWVAGVLYKQAEDDLLREYTYADSDFTSLYTPSSTALYGQITLPVKAVSLEAGLRVEQQQIDYQDSNGFVENNDETLVGGKVALSYVRDMSTLYGFVARGFKAGGFNPDERVSDAQRIYEAEYNWHYELGVKSRLADGDASVRVALFYMTRENTQISDYDVLVQDNDEAGNAQPVEFIDIIDNADTGINQGVEAELSWQLNPNVDVGFNVGYLDATFSGFTRNDGSVIDKQRQAQAPKYTAHAFINMNLNDDLLWHVSVDAKSSHRFSDGHDEINPGYGIVNTRVTMPLSGALSGWELSAFVHNVTDKTYYVRGFGGFSNDPREYYEIPKGYVQFGGQRQTGVQVSYAF
ncbi:MAG: TonB-dependent receptor plug domain-containing protein [Glaciecola sp.]|nr:TonB-dependent receptor plug domain-containing protein [Glaciecola sp.]MDG2099679.1 TonB-dependent receptor plug domain-containing protein [Glaciecola sp.]